VSPGAEVSFEEFVQARWPHLFRMAFLLTGRDRAEAEDLLQMTLERAYRHWTRISRSGQPERYVRRVLINASNDRWRRLRRRPERPLRAEADHAAGDQMSETDDRDFLLRALATLPRKQRAVLVLRYFEDLSEAETADLLGCGIGTVKSHASRGLARLREMAQPDAELAAGRNGGGEHDG
jgi:RNA polymerase sigma-70 factor (sigma-E family)